MKQKVDLINGRPGRSVFLFALPMIAGNLFQQFYNMADAVIVGRFVGEDALAAVGASYSFTTVFIMVAIGGGMGASVLVSQYLGAAKYREMKTAVSTFLLAFAAVGILLAVFGFFANPTILRALKTPDNIFTDAVLYLQIYFVGLPFMFMYNILAANFNALGKSDIPLYLLIFSSVLNVLLDLAMVLCFGMGVAGVAIATVLAQGLSSLISFTILLRKLKEFDTKAAGGGAAAGAEERKIVAGVKERGAAAGAEERKIVAGVKERGAAAGTEEKDAVKASGKGGLFDVTMFVSGLKIAIPSIIQQSIVSIGMLLTQSAVNAFGSSAVAGYSAGMRLESICIVPMIATGNAMSTFAAQNLGAGNAGRVREGYHAAYRIIIGFAVFLLLASQLFYRPVVSLFVSETESAAAFSIGAACFRFEACFMCLIGFKSITDGILRAAGDVNVYMLGNLVNLTIRVAVARLLSPIFGIEVIWYAVPMGWAANYLISFFWYRTGHWERKNLIGR